MLQVIIAEVCSRIMSEQHQAMDRDRWKDVLLNEFKCFLQTIIFRMLYLKYVLNYTALKRKDE